MDHYQAYKKHKYVCKRIPWAHNIGIYPYNLLALRHLFVNL